MFNAQFFSLRFSELKSLLTRIVRRFWFFLSGNINGGKRSSSVASPWIADYEKVGLVWRPYVMRLCRPNQRTVSVETDFMGFRITRYRGEIFSFTEYRGRNDTSVLLGNSAAFGVGASRDEYSIANRLAFITDQPWFNLSGRASNMLQDVLALLLFGAQTHNSIVLMSGLNDLLFALHFEHATRNFPTFWSDDCFATLNNSDSVVDRNFSELLDVEDRYIHALEGINRALLLLARYGFEHQTHILIALQPLLAWTEKPLHANEEAMCAEWDAIKSGFRVTHRHEIVQPWKNRFTDDVRKLCMKYELDFVDLNIQPLMLTGDHLFTDRIHLTDRGQQIVAELIADHIQNSRAVTRGNF